MDAEHKQLFGLIEKCIQAARDNEAKGRVTGLPGRIESHLARHLKDEEDAMCTATSRQFDARKKQHKYILEKVSARISHFKANDTSITAQDILFVLYDWYAAHHASEDRKLAEFLRGDGHTGNFR